jgi:micrococcal nuclease
MVRPVLFRARPAPPRRAATARRWSPRRALGLVAAATIVLLAAAGCGGGRASPGAGDTARVLRVVDGDTILVAVGGRSERVRYIGIDTPESVKPGTPVQCYAKRASRENEQLVGGRTVRLVGDAEARDRYGRRLAYVYRSGDGLFVNAALVRDGYARTMTIAPNTAHATEFAGLARTARASARGLWGACAR